MPMLMDDVHVNGFERVRFYAGQLITADDLNQEQQYHRARQREHNRLLHGWGIVCGCDVQPAGTTEAPWQVRICPGYILTPQGDTVSIRAEALFDLANCFLRSEDPCAFARPCPPVYRRALTENTIYLAVRYSECETRPQRTAAVGCSCDDATCEYSRIIDSYEFCCLAGLPSTHIDEAVDCEALFDSTRIVPCLPCPADPWVVLATIRLPTSVRELVEEVDATHQRKLSSTTQLQQMVHCTRDAIPT